MKGFIFIPLAILLIVGLILSGCSSPAPSQSATAPITSAAAAASPSQSATAPITSTAAAASSPTSVSGGNTMTLGFDTFLPKSAPDYQVDQKYFAGLSQVTNGQVKVEEHLGAVMGAPPETYDRVTSGVSDIGQILPVYTPGVFPMTALFAQPIYAKSHVTTVKALLDIYHKGYLNSDFTKIVPIALSGTGTYALFTNEKITTVDQLKGLKIRGDSTVWAEVSKAVGAAGVTMQTGDVYNGFQTGLLDGAWWVWAAVTDFKLQEVAKYALPVDITFTVHVRGMNKDTYDKLPESAKKYIADNFDSYSMDLAKAYDAQVQEGQKIFLAQSPQHEITSWAPGEQDKFGVELAPVWDTWLKQGEAKNLPVKQEAADLYSILQQSGVSEPFIGYKP